MAADEKTTIEQCEKVQAEIKKLIDASEIRLVKVTDNHEKSIAKLWTRIESDREKTLKECSALYDKIIVQFGNYKDEIAKENRKAFIAMAIQIVVTVIGIIVIKS